MKSNPTSPNPRRRARKRRTPRIRGARAALLLALLASTSCGSPKKPPAETPGESSPPAAAHSVPAPSVSESSRTEAPGRPEATRPEVLQITRVALLPRAPRAGDTLTAEVESNDPSQNAFLTYRWFVNGEENPGWRGNTFAGPFKRGDEVSVAVSLPGTSSMDSAVTDSVRIGNAPPQVEKIQSPRFEEGRYTTRIVASDPEGDPLSFSIVKGPEGLSIDETGRITWTPGENDLGRHEVTISVKDDSGGEIVYTYAFSVDRQ